MTVSCPSCQTRYKLPPRSKLGRNPTYRCTKCRHVFSPEAEAEAPAVDEEQDDEINLDIGDDDDDAPVFTIEPTSRRGKADDEEDDDEEDQTPVRRRGRGGGDGDGDGLPARPQSTARFATWAALFVALVYGVLSIYLHTHPAEARGLFGQIPFIGDEMRETRLHPGLIQLADVKGEFKRVHGDRLVFVITGVAINNAPVPVAGVQIQGRVIGAEDRRQIVYAGAAPQDVADLGIREIELLQTLKPSNDWVLRQGEQDRFLVAFVEPQLPLSEFAAEVIAVRGVNGRVEGPLAKRD
jgi:predicted Zn finger-like uncharacterized protein